MLVSRLLRCLPTATASPAAWVWLRLLAILAVAAWLSRSASVAAAGPTGLDRPLVMTQIPVDAARESSPRPEASLRRKDFGEGSRLVLVAPDGSLRLLTPGFHSACDPDVSFDGRRILFAGRRAAGDSWNVYELTLEGLEIRAITRGPSDCRSPCYVSAYYQISDNDDVWQQIAFVRLDRAASNELTGEPASALYTCKLDGSYLRRITFNLSSDFDPAVLWDGRIVFASCQQRDLTHGRAGRVVLLDVNCDGTDYAPLAVDSGLRIKHMPCSTPSGLAVFVESDQASWDGAGRLASISLVRPLHTYQPIPGEPGELFHSPSPLPDSTLLVSRRPEDGSATHGVWRLDPSNGQKDAVYDEPQWHDVQAKLVAPRPEPEGRSSSIVDSDPTGILYCLNVYTADRQTGRQLPAGSARRLQVLEGLPRRPDAGQADAGQAGEPGGNQGSAARRVLGELDIAADGSFQVRVPANIPLELQILDQRGLPLRSCGWVWTRNHFNQGCVGCHEDPELVPENEVAEAFAAPAPSLPVLPDPPPGTSPDASPPAAP